MLKRLKTAAALLAGAAVIVLFPALRADAAEGNVTLSGDGVLTLSGELTRDQILAYRQNPDVTSIVAEQGAVLPADCSYLFQNTPYYSDTAHMEWENVQTVDLSAADASQVTNAEYMFAGADYYRYPCAGKAGYDSSYRSIDLHGLNTSRADNMSSMFCACLNLADLDVSGMDTSAVTDMEFMFYKCGRLMELDVSSFSTSKVTTMRTMFSYCESLTRLDLSSFNTSKVTTMRHMFSYCRSLRELDLSSFNTSKVTTMEYMFLYCRSLRELDLCSFDTSHVTTIESMFKHCSNLRQIMVSDRWSLASLQSSSGIFTCCEQLKGGNGTHNYWNSNISSTVNQSYLARPDTPRQSGLLTADINISAQPQDTIACAGDTAVLTVSAWGGDLTYQWQCYNAEKDAWVNSGLEGSKTDSLSVPATFSRSGMKYRCVIKTEYSTLTTDEAELTVYPAGQIISQPQYTGVTVGETAGFNVKALGDPLTYQWQYNSGSGWKNSGAVGARTDTLHITAKMAYDGYQYRCIVGSENGEAVSEAAKLSVIDISIYEQPKNLAILYGNSSNLSVSATGDPLVYQWQCNDGSGWNNISGKTSRTLPVYAESAVNGSQFRCKIKSASMSSWYVISDAATVTVLPRIYTHPQNVTVPYGSSDDVYFSCSAGGIGLQYQWQYDSGSGWQNSNAEGAQTQQIRMTANRSRDGYQYRCVITDQNGKQLTTSAALLRFETGNVVLSADGVLTLIGEPTRAQILAYRTDQNVTAVVAAKGMVLPANCAELFWNGQSIYHHEYDEEYYNDYYWYSDLYYWKNVKSIDLSQADASKVTTMRKMFGSYDGRKLDYDYDDEDFLMGWYTLRRFGYSPYTSINLSGLDTSRVKDMSAMFHGCTALTDLRMSGISTSAVTTMRKMFCKCTALTTLDLRSFDTAKVTEMTSMFSGMPAVEAITVSDKWSTAAVTEGNGADMFCDCQKLTGGNGTAFDSTKTDSSYARIDKPGQPGYLSGNAQIITQPQNASAAAGKTVTLTVSASGAGLSYQWQYNSGDGWKKSNGIGAQTDTLTLTANASRSGYQYRCVVTDAHGNQATSAAATVKVVPVTVSAPQSVSGIPGSTLTLSVTATGASLSYQWQYNSGDGWKKSNGIGAQTDTLTLTANASRSGYQYRCVVTDAGGNTVISDAATVTVAPVILWSPQDVSAEAGSTVYLRCTASGAALTYQWQYNSGSGWKNSNAAGAQTTLLTLTANANRSGYQYRCVVTDQYGNTVISDAAAVTVK